MGKTKNSSRSKTIKIIKIKKKFKEKVLREVFVLPSNPLSTWKISFFFIKKSNGKSIINTDNNKDKEKTITILISFSKNKSLHYCYYNFMTISIAELAKIIPVKPPTVNKNKKPITQ